MKPIIELSAAVVGEQVRVKDQLVTIEGTLSSFRVWSESEVIREGFGRIVKTVTDVFIEAEFVGIDGTTQLTTRAEFAVVE